MNKEVLKIIKENVKGKKLTSRKPTEISQYFEKCPFCENIILKNPGKEKTCPICFNMIFDEEAYTFSMKLPDNNRITVKRTFDFVRDTYKLEFMIEPNLLKQEVYRRETLGVMNLYHCKYVNLTKVNNYYILYVSFESTEEVHNDSIIIDSKSLNDAEIVANKLREYIK